MGILCDQEIIKAVEKGYIYIEGFNPNREYDGKGGYNGRLGPNSYDLSLNEKILIYTDIPLDMKKKNETKELFIPKEGLILYPGKLYLAMTNEYTKTDNYVPIIEGRSSGARLGIQVHLAGFGDNGFSGRWTLEITVAHPVRIYAGVNICQIYFQTLKGKSNNKYNGKYNDSKDVLATKMYDDEIFQTVKDLNRVSVSDKSISSMLRKDDCPKKFDTTDNDNFSIDFSIKGEGAISKFMEQYKSEMIQGFIDNEKHNKLLKDQKKKEPIKSNPLGFETFFYGVTQKPKWFKAVTNVKTTKEIEDEWVDKSDKPFANISKRLSDIISNLETSINESNAPVSYRLQDHDTSIMEFVEPTGDILPFILEAAGVNRLFIQELAQQDDKKQIKEIKDMIHENIERYKAYGTTKFDVKDLLTGKDIVLDISNITYKDITILLTNNQTFVIQFTDDNITVSLKDFLLSIVG